MEYNQRFQLLLIELIIIVSTALGMENIGQLYGRNLRVVSIEMPPYLMTVDNPGSPFKGLIPDVLTQLSKRLHFEYNISLQNRFGGLNKATNIWSGMMGDVVRNEHTNGTEGADIAAAHLTINSRRQGAVDFVKPFRHSGLAIILKKPASTAGFGSWWTFDIFSPFTAVVWVVILVAYVFVSFLLWVIGKWDPYELRGLHSDHKVDETFAETFTLPSCFWFVFTSGNKQGYEHGPQSVSGRILMTSWFCLTTILIASFISGIAVNLYWASFPHFIPNADHSIQSLNDLIKRATLRKDFLLGVIPGSSDDRYLQSVALGNEFDAIRSYLESDVAVKHAPLSLEDGMKKTRRGNFGWLLNTVTGKYIVNQRPCDLMMIDTGFGIRSFGFAVPKTAFALKRALDVALLELVEEGVIEELEEKWEVGHGQCWNFTTMENQKDAVSMLALQHERPQSNTVQSFGGPLLALLIGAISSVCATLFEYLFTKRSGVRDVGSPRQELKNEET